jgi:predicted metal-dependent hydrolase
MATEESVEINGRRYEIIRKKTLSSRASARLLRSSIIITIPVFIGRDHAAALFSHMKRRMMNRIKRAGASPFRKADIAFRDGQTVNVLGMKFVIEVSSDPKRKRSTARLRGSTIRISTAPGVNELDSQLLASRLARKVISKAVLPAVESRVRDINAAHFNSNLGRIRLKDNTSNWGSCSGPNNINLDFRLLFAPTSVLDAVIAHELAHTTHRNHSKRFYSKLQSAMPDYKHRRRWLRQNGNLLDSDSSIPYSIALPGCTQKEQPEVAVQI